MLQARSTSSLHRPRCIASARHCYFQHAVRAPRICRNRLALRCAAERPPQHCRPAVLPAVLAAASAGLLMLSNPAVADVIQTVPASTLTDYARPIPKQENVPKGTVWLLFIGGAVALFGSVVLIENKTNWFPAISKANAAMADKKSQVPSTEYQPPPAAAPQPLPPLDREPYFTQDFGRAAPLDREPYFTQDYEQLPKPEDTAAVLAGLAQARSKVLESPSTPAPSPTSTPATPSPAPAASPVEPSTSTAPATFPATLSSPAAPTPVSEAAPSPTTATSHVELPAAASAKEEAAVEAAADPVHTAPSSASTTWQAVETPPLQPASLPVATAAQSAPAAEPSEAAASDAAAVIAGGAAAAGGGVQPQAVEAPSPALDTADAAAVAEPAAVSENGAAAAEVKRPKAVVGMTDEQLEQMIEARRALAAFKAQAAAAREQQQQQA